MKKAEEVRGTLRKNQKLMAIKVQELAEGRQEIAELERTWRSYEAQEKGAPAQREIQLNEDQVCLSKSTTSSAIQTNQKSVNMIKNINDGRPRPDHVFLKNQDLVMQL